MPSIMQLGLVTIQRNRAPWLAEWFAFHYLVGFRAFYFYAHLCDDATHATLAKLSQRLNITSMAIGERLDRVQLMAYQHACANYLGQVDWMAFLDGDEFLFPSSATSLQEVLANYGAPDYSALGVYNYNFGSSGHIAEPSGLITDNYRLRAADDFLPHRRVKSLLRGRQQAAAGSNSHLFATERGTVDERLRPLSWGYMPDYVPSYQQLRIHHYVCQSQSYYQRFKKHSGHADASAAAVREDDWWRNFDTNVLRDDAVERFAPALRALVAQWQQELDLPPPGV